MGMMSRLDACCQDLDLIREDITELDLDAAINKVEALLGELVRINAGAVACVEESMRVLADRHRIV